MKTQNSENFQFRNFQKFHKFNNVEKWNIFKISQLGKLKIQFGKSLNLEFQTFPIWKISKNSNFENSKNLHKFYNFEKSYIFKISQLGKFKIPQNSNFMNYYIFYVFE